jgi:hypothetical protein
VNLGVLESENRIGSDSAQRQSFASDPKGVSFPSLREGVQPIVSIRATDTSSANRKSWGLRAIRALLFPAVKIVPRCAIRTTNHLSFFKPVSAAAKFKIQIRMRRMGR